MIWHFWPLKYHVPDTSIVATAVCPATGDLTSAAAPAVRRLAVKPVAIRQRPSRVSRPSLLCFWRWRFIDSLPGWLHLTGTRIVRPFHLPIRPPGPVFPDVRLF